MIFFIVSIILSLDQITKFFITGNLALGESRPIINGIFHLTLVHNQGAAFGLLKNQIPLFVLASFFAIFLIYRSLQQHKGGGNLYRVSLCLILAGALGNLIDRLFFGYVIDFLDFRVWPVFNLADSAITVGAILLGYYILIKPERKVKPETKNSKLKTKRFV